LLGLLHQANKDIVKRRLVLLGLLDRDVGVVLEQLEDQRQRGACLVGVDIQQPWLPTTA